MECGTFRVNLDKLSLLEKRKTSHALEQRIGRHRSFRLGGRRASRPLGGDGLLGWRESGALHRASRRGGSRWFLSPVARPARQRCRGGGAPLPLHFVLAEDGRGHLRPSRAKGSYIPWAGEHPLSAHSRRHRHFSSLKLLQRHLLITQAVQRIFRQ